MRELEELEQLRNQLKLTALPHYDPLWSAAPDFLRLIVEHCLMHRPQFILECSSGTSTLMLAAACRLNGLGRVVSLENDAACAERSQAQLDRQGLSAFAEILYAPLVDYTLEDACYLWYRLDQLPPGPFDLLVIDGPPGRLQNYARYPALPLLMQYLTEQAVVFLDDADRPDEQAIIQLWQRQFPRWQGSRLPSQRGCYRLNGPAVR